MQLALAGLDAHLARKLDPLYVIHGDETLFAIIYTLTRATPSPS